MSRRFGAELIRAARAQAKVSQADLARRAGMPRSVVNAYERGGREPGSEAVAKLLRAAGVELRLHRATAVDVERNGRILEQVLDLAEQLPNRRRGALRYPSFKAEVRTASDR